MEWLDEANKLFEQASYLEEQGPVGSAEPFFSAAEDRYRKAIEGNTRGAPAHHYYALFLSHRDRREEADREFRAAINLEPDDENIQADYRDFLNKFSGPGVEEPEPIEPPQESKKAPEQTAAGFNDGSGEPVMETGSDAEPEEPPAEPEPELDGKAREVEGYWAWGEYQQKENGDLAEAEKAFRQALSLDPNDLQSLVSYTKLLLHQARYAEAEEYLFQMSQIDLPTAYACIEAYNLESNPALLALRGLLALRAGELEEAELYLLQAVERKSEGEDEAQWTGWVLAYAGLLVDLERSSEAVQTLGRLLEGGTVEEAANQAALHRELTRLLLPTRDFEAVRSHLNIARQLDSEHPEMTALSEEVEPVLDRYDRALRLMALAKMKARLGSEDAYATYQTALKFDPDNIQILEAYAQYLEEQQRFDDAERILMQLAQISPETAEKHIQSILQARGENPATLYHLAHILIQLDRQELAEDHLRKSLRMNPDNDEALLLIVDLLLGQNREREAAKLLSGHLAKVRQNADLCLRYARLLSAKREYHKAREFFEQAAAIGEGETYRQALDEALPKIEKYDRANFIMALGWREAKIENYGEAENLFKQALEIDPEHLPTLRQYAQLLEVTNRTEDCIHLLNQLAQIDPEWTDNYFRDHLPETGRSLDLLLAYAKLLLELGRNAEAKEQLRLALQLEPGHQPTLDLYIDLLLQEDDLRGAEIALSGALDLGDPEIHWRYGQLLIQNRHRYDLAKRPFLIASQLSTSTQYLDALQQLSEKVGQSEELWAWAEEKVGEGEAEEAEIAFLKAYEACPEFIPNLFGYGEFLFEQGRLEEARRFLQEVLDLDPYFEDKELIEDRLNEIDAGRQAMDEPVPETVQAEGEIASTEVDPSPKEEPDEDESWQATAESMQEAEAPMVETQTPEAASTDVPRWSAGWIEPAKED